MTEIFNYSTGSAKIRENLWLKIPILYSPYFYYPFNLLSSYYY
jgi:hypothetical protein